jgi:hypothetical protein
MRLIAFLFLAAFGLAGVMRYSKAAAPAPATALAPGETLRPLAAAPGAQAPMPLASTAAPAPAPQVLRHKRRFAKAALRALKKAEAQEQVRPQKQMVKLKKAPRR